MAYSPEQWDRAKFLFELGRSVREIEKDTGISNGQITKKANKEKWQKEAQKKQLKSDILGFEEKKEALEREKEALIDSVASLSKFEITILSDVVENELGKKSLLFSTSMLALARCNQQLTKGKKQSIVKVKTYSSEGRPDGETVEVVDIDLSPTDIKESAETVDKISLTLGINQRHANIKIDNTNATQNNYSPQEISQAIADGLPD